jgi:hypothetical protein
MISERNYPLRSRASPQHEFCKAAGAQIQLYSTEVGLRSARGTSFRLPPGIRKKKKAKKKAARF